jgi:parvulin-like peptidyl-prolyl isomerase
MRIFLVAALLLGPLLAAYGDPPNGIRAVVHDSVITSDEVEMSIDQTAMRLSRQYQSQPELFQTKLNELRSAKLEELLDRQLILREFKVAGYSLPDSVVDEMVDEEIKAKFRDRATATKSLQEEGLTYEKFRQQVRDQFVVVALRQKNVSSEVIISPHKIETYYAAHKDDFKVEEEVKLRMIVQTNSPARDAAATRKMTEEILSKLNDGATWDEMAMYSERSSRNPGAETFQISNLRKELAEAVTKLKAGQRSGVIETPDGCYLIQVETIQPAHVKPLGEVRVEIERDLKSQERARLEKQWIERLKKKTFYRYF